MHKTARSFHSRHDGVNQITAVEGILVDLSDVNVRNLLDLSKDHSSEGQNVLVAKLVAFEVVFFASAPACVLTKVTEEVFHGLSACGLESNVG